MVLNYLKLVFPSQFSDLEYLSILINGSFHRAPQLLFPYVKKLPDLNKEQVQAFAKVRKRVIIEILSFAAILIYFIILILISDGIDTDI